ncbi:MAG: hypothetical protein EXX96DRAFT_552339 [Benjaminiella poitrasii]|nr:MAG: hypothetical protein EXX96DRAFT_552339 [Benjaminiella poitrasii]
MPERISASAAAAALLMTIGECSGSVIATASGISAIEEGSVVDMVWIRDEEEVEKEVDKESKLRVISFLTTKGLLIGKL